MSYFRIFYKGQHCEHKKYYKDKDCKIIHREDGPAIEFSNGGKFWVINGKFHKEDGPAIIFSNNDVEYWLNDISYSEKEYLEEIDKIKRLGAFA